MTLREATEAAMAGKKVTFGGIVYRRITACGYRYRPDGTFVRFAELADMNTGTVVSAPPDRVEVWEGGDGREGQTAGEPL